MKNIHNNNYTKIASKRLLYLQVSNKRNCTGTYLRNSETCYYQSGCICIYLGLSDRSLHICILAVYELICKKSIRLIYIKLYIDTFVMIIRTLS